MSGNAKNLRGRGSKTCIEHRSLLGPPSTPILVRHCNDSIYILARKSLNVLIFSLIVRSFSYFRRPAELRWPNVLQCVGRNRSLWSNDDLVS